MMSCIVGLKPSRILVCGGRDFNDWDFFIRRMNEYHAYFHKRFCIIQGGATGADSFAKAWAQIYGKPCIQVDADWQFHGPRAGMLRNEWMLEFCQPQIVIAFPGGPGTAGMISRARLAHVPVEIVEHGKS